VRGRVGGVLGVGLGERMSRCKRVCGGGFSTAGGTWLYRNQRLGQLRGEFVNFLPLDIHNLPRRDPDTSLLTLGYSKQAGKKRLSSCTLYITMKMK
jgi:hypothetical protein